MDLEKPRYAGGWGVLYPVVLSTGSTLEPLGELLKVPMPSLYLQIKTGIFGDRAHVSAFKLPR